MNKKLFAALAASSVLLAVCTACGESSSQAESSVAETTAAESSAAETTAPESSEAAESVAAEDIEFEEPVVAEDGHAFLYINDGQFYVSYDGTANSLMTYAAGVPEITGDGTYTVSVDAGTKGCQFDIGGIPINGFRAFIEPVFRVLALARRVFDHRVSDRAAIGSNLVGFHFILLDNGICSIGICCIGRRDIL